MQSVWAAPALSRGKLRDESASQEAGGFTHSGYDRFCDPIH